MIKKLKKIKISESTFNQLAIKFENNHIDNRHGEDHYELVAHVEDELVGVLEYSEYSDELYVKMLTVADKWKRKGVATSLLKKLQEMNPKTEIELGYASDEGANLVKTIEREFVPNKDYIDLKNELDGEKAEYERILKNVEIGNRSEIEKLNDLNDTIQDMESKLGEIKNGFYYIKL